MSDNHSSPGCPSFRPAAPPSAPPRPRLRPLLRRSYLNHSTLLAGDDDEGGSDESRSRQRLYLL